MRQSISNIALIVPDYDAALSFYVGVLGFDLKSDVLQPDGKRWVTVCPPGNSATCLLLAKAATDEEISRVGNQTGGCVFLFLSTDNFDRDYDVMRNKGVTFLERPRIEPFGKVAVFTDPFGNKWDLIEPVDPTK